jgi:hypothetical protein
MTLATRYPIGPARLDRVLASLDRSAHDAVGYIRIDNDPYRIRHDQLDDLTILAGWLRALAAEGHLELEVKG